MQESEILKQFYRFNRNVRLRYLETLAKLPREELMRARKRAEGSLLSIARTELVAEELERWTARN